MKISKAFLLIPAIALLAAEVQGRPLPLSGSWPLPLRVATAALRGFRGIFDLMGTDDWSAADWEEDEEVTPTTMQIAMIGLGRTGSTSLTIALETLGYNVFHDDEYMESTDLYSLWEKEEIDDDEFHVRLGRRGYNVSAKSATIEWVSSRSDIKAILTVRDSPEKYADSWMTIATMYDIVNRRPYIWFNATRNLLDSMEEEFLYEPTDNAPEKAFDRDHLMSVYTKYNERAQNLIPSNRLLVFNVKQGWVPLCEFLEIEECPTTPFPHVNSRIEVQTEHFVLELFTWVWPLPFIPFALLLSSLVQRYRIKAKVI